ncbi:MAG TPA: type I DNA topoisomerase [Polyangiaceae bacterium]|nr:type I DNA topoisomerase [Polyangiaceae bacterium]
MSDKSLVIVESPAKAKTIAAFLGPDFIVESSIGHIRDLPRRASDVPPKYKKEAWARLGVDVDADFKPLYIIDADKRDHIKRLKSLLSEADRLYLATDEDREGESIAWHLLEVLQPKVPVLRMAFHEITKKAIQAAIQNPRDIDQRLVNAQEARRILDRLYGYEVSPVLWKKVMPKLSAGRVQSVSTRMVVDREIARMRFVLARYWDVDGTFATPDGSQFQATLVGVDGRKVATGKDFDEDGKLTRDDVFVLGEEQAKALAAALPSSSFQVASVEQKPNRRSPPPPFMTSTLQQEASRKLRFSSARTMRAAQDLYESGHITYMRTDSTTLSDTALTAARNLIQELYGQEYLPPQPRRYANKVKNAQEAHEAIRPAGDAFRHPADVAREVGGDQGKLYELIWKRTVACQMEDSRGQSVKLSISAQANGQELEFAVTGNTITFPGFLRAYVEGSDDPSQELEQRERPLPAVSEGEKLTGSEFEPKPHETQPPARYTEASLVKRLEELGVGRPSTYASILSTIQQRGYVWKKGSALVPSFKAFAVVQLLEKHFADLVDYAFTARMEDELDAIAEGREEAVPWLKRFYFGVDAAPAKNKKAPPAAPNSNLSVGLRTLVAERLNEIDARAINSLPLGKDDQDRDIIIRVGRYGPYLQRQDDTASLPEDLPPDEVTLEKAIQLLEAPSGDRLLGTDPESGLPVYVRTGRFGAYVQLGEAGGKEKPRTGSLLKTMTPASMTLEDALKMLSLPRVVGEHPESHEPITAQLGRYGPYITCGKDSRSVEKEEDVFTITLEQALQLLAQPKTRGRRKAAEPIKTLGKDEFSGGEITLREGRFGYYVTDGETNASLSKGDSIETIDNARAQELLHNRRERGPVTKKKAKKKAAAKAAKADKSAQKAAANASEANGEPDEHDEDEAPASARKSAAPRASARPAGKKAPAKKLASKKAPAKKAAPKNNSSRARASESTDGGERRSAPAGNKKRPSAKSGSRSKSLD